MGKQLEEKTDTLHELIEKDLENKILNPGEKEQTAPEMDQSNWHQVFMDYRSNVSNLTLVTQNWLQKILADVGVGSADGIGLTGSSPAAGPAAAPSMSDVPSALPQAAKKRTPASAPSGG